MFGRGFPPIDCDREQSGPFYRNLQEWSLRNDL